MNKEDNRIGFYDPGMNIVISTACIKTQVTAVGDPHESNSYS